MFIQQSLENYLGFPCKCVSFCEAGTYQKPSGDSVKDLRVLQVARRGLEGSFLLSRFCVLPHHPPLVPFSCTFVLSFPSQQGLGEITTAGVGPCCGLVAAFILYSPNPFQSPILLKDKGYFFFYLFSLKTTSKQYNFDFFHPEGSVLSWREFPFVVIVSLNADMKKSVTGPTSLMSPLSKSQVLSVL